MSQLNVIFVSITCYGMLIHKAEIVIHNANTVKPPNNDPPNSGHLSYAFKISGTDAFSSYFTSEERPPLTRLTTRVFMTYTTGAHLQT